jgi:Glyoxalase-like domain
MGRSRSGRRSGNRPIWPSGCGGRRPCRRWCSTVPEGKAAKNRLHLDLRPVGASPEAEVERLLGLGARPADIGQGQVPWVVLADPEGNEFCVLGQLDDHA